MLGKAPTSAAIDVAFFILMVGGFLSCERNRYPYVGIASIVRKYKGREKMLILILMPLFALVVQLMVWVKKPWPSIHFLYLL